MSKSCKIRHVDKNAKSLNNCDVKHRKRNADYDIIVVGAGTAGSCLAYNLANNHPNLRIAVIDAGQDDVRIKPTDPVVPNPNNPQDDWGQVLRQGVLGQEVNIGEGCAIWQYKSGADSDSQPAALTRYLAYPRGSTWGGTSAINGTLWQRGSKKGTWDRWEAIAGPEWGFEKTNESYKKIENRTNQSGIYGWKHFNPAGTPDDINTFDPRYHGNFGRLYIHAGGHATLVNSIQHQSAINSVNNIFPGRFSINKAWENPDYDELVSASIFTLLDQTDPEILSKLQYPPDTPGPFGPFAGFAYAQGAPNPPFNTPLLAARSYGAPSFMYPIENLPNVTIISRAYVTKLIFSNDKKEILGVEYLKDGWNVNKVGRSIPKRPVGQPVFPPFTITGKDGARPEDTVTALENAERYVIRASGDIWLCAGAIDTPAILQRSGIGDKEYLESLQDPVKTVVDLPGVGENLYDHPDILYYFKTNKLYPNNLGEGGYYVNNGVLPTLTTIRYKSDPTKPFANIQCVISPNNVYTGGKTYLGGILNGAAPPLNVGKLSPSAGSKLSYDPQSTGQLQIPPVDVETLYFFFNQQFTSNSRGSVRILTSDPTVPPAINANLFGNETDVQDQINSFKYTIYPLAVGLASQTVTLDPANPPFGLQNNGGNPFFVEWLSPDSTNLFDDLGNIDETKLTQFIKKSFVSAYHPTSTCMMGRPESPESVVDPKLRVYNIKGLRIADVSVCPVSPDCNTQAPAYVIGQRASEIIQPLYNKIFS
jgi:choline dehydrogenase-like flavoprotein